MMKFKYILLLVLITLLCFGAVEAFYHVLGKRLATEHVAPQASEERQGVAQVVKDTGKKIDIQAITRRNLFAVKEGSAAIDQNTDPLKGVELSSLAVVLMGTVTGADGEQRAIIYDKKAKRQELYQEGDFIDQAIIKKILRGKVIIQVNGKDEMLDISDARTVRVPQVRSVVPTTTMQRVISRPVGPPKVAAPATSKPKLIKSYRGGVIVKKPTSGKQ